MLSTASSHSVLLFGTKPSVSVYEQRSIETSNSTRGLLRDLGSMESEYLFMILMPWAMSVGGSIMFACTYGFLLSINVLPEDRVHPRRQALFAG